MKSVKEEKLDEILDKISKYGIGSIRPFEKSFLDSYPNNELISIEDDIFVDDYGFFKFEYKDTKIINDVIHIAGTIFVPDILLKEVTIYGRLEGEILLYKNGQTCPFFEKTYKGEVFDIFDFCDGMEYELDNFIDFIISKLEKSNSGN